MDIEVTDELVLHIARLSRLALSTEESREIQKHFRNVLAFVEDFQKLDTSGVEPSHFSVDTANVDREDEAAPSLPPETAIRNAAVAAPPHFVVPRIVGGTEEDAGGGA